MKIEFKHSSNKSWRLYISSLLLFLIFSIEGNQENINSLKLLNTSLTFLNQASIPLRVQGPMEPVTRQASKKIGILAWGSLVNDPRDLKTLTPFQKTSLKFPIQLSRLSAQGKENQRLTRIIDKDLGEPIFIWHTSSFYNTLPEARENLRVREGTPSLSNIFYIKTIMPGKIPSPNEKEVLDLRGNSIKDLWGNKWVVIDSGLQQLEPSFLINLVKWASDQEYQAVIWTGLGRNKNFNTYPKIKNVLRDPRTLANTKAYIRNLPDQQNLTTFEKEILNLR